MSKESADLLQGTLDKIILKALQLGSIWHFGADPANVQGTAKYANQAKK